MQLPPVYAITSGEASRSTDVTDSAARLFRSGIRLLQVRERKLSDRDLLDAVEGVRRLGEDFAATVLVNDRVDVARIAGCGVHVGEDDLPADVARRLLPAGTTVGVSTHDLDAARRAFADGAADYVAFGPIFDSRTKPGRSARRLEALAELAATKTRPLVAIGGITDELLDAVFDAGADSAAVVGALAADGAIEANARRLLDRARRRTPPGRLYLVGFMGAGKTAIGRRVAARLGIPFVDLDAEIERTSGRTVRALFESAGEAAFRHRESAFLAGTEALPHAVIATGGGAFVGEANRRTIAMLGTAVFVDVPFAVVRSRLAGKTDRPLFASVEQAARLYDDRSPFYRMAPVRVPLTGRESIEESADKLLSAVYDRRELQGPALAT